MSVHVNVVKRNVLRWDANRLSGEHVDLPLVVGCLFNTRIQPAVNPNLAPIGGVAQVTGHGTR